MAKTSKGAPGDYEIGRGKPPKHTRFPPGKSGNPGGRKKGSLNLKTVITAVLESEIELCENGRSSKVPLLEALLKKQAQVGLRGHVRAIDSLLDRYERCTGGGEQSAEELPDEDRALLERTLARSPARSSPRNAHSSQEAAHDSLDGDPEAEPGTAYHHNWHIDHLCWQLTRVARGEVRRLIINVPPRSMKSIAVSVGFTAWMLGRDPTQRIICVSYADDLARKLSTDTRTIIDSPWYRELYPALQLATKRPRTMELVTTQQGYRFATGISGSILGRGADLIVIDDPLKATDALSQAERRRVNEAFDSTLYTRLNDKRTGAIVLIMQRLHEDDLVGHVVARGDWELVSIPAIETEDRCYRLSDDPEEVHHRRAGEVLHDEREPREILEAARRAQGSLLFSAQYQQAPVPPEGNIVKREWLRYYEQAPSAFDITMASWDTASTLSEDADYSVGTVWGAKGLDFYLLDRVRGRFEVPELRRQVIGLARRWGADQTVIEDTDIGRAVTQDLRRSGEYRAILRRPRFDKEARFLAQSARFESGQVHVPRQASWLAEWLNELLAFPHGRHDDQVDSTSQALDYLSKRVLPLHASREPLERPAARPRPAGFRRPPGFKARDD